MRIPTLTTALAAVLAPLAELVPRRVLGPGTVLSWKSALTVLALLSTPALAQRHLWLVPGTAGIPFEGVRWDRASGRIIAATGDTIVSIDPVCGCPVLLHRTRPQSSGPTGPKVLELVLGPGGVIDFTQSGPTPGQPDGRIYRLTPDGRVQVIAGRGDAGPFQGDALDARDGRFHPTDLAAGRHGERYLADAVHGAVLLLEPQPDGQFRLRTLAGKDRSNTEGYDSDQDDLLDDGDGSGPFPAEIAHLTEGFEEESGLDQAIQPRVLAAAPDGSLFLADWSKCEFDRPPWVFRLSPPPAGAESDWQLQRLPVPGMAECQCPPGQWRFPVRKPHRLEVGDDGTVYILGHNLLWAFSPLAVGQAEESGPQWSCEAIAGPLAAKTVVAAWPHQGAPADELDPALLRRISHMAAVPGGGLLLSDGVDGIRFLGPAGDAALGERVRTCARAALADEVEPARRVLAALVRSRDQPYGLRSRGLCRAATVAPSLGAGLQGNIDAFLADPKVLAFRAAMAVQALRAGGDASPDPRERILAQRHVWQVPGTLGSSFGAIAWDPGSGTLVAACDQELRRLDPVRGTGTVQYAIPPAGAGPGTPQPLPGSEFYSLVAQPGGAIAFSTATLGGDSRDGQVWRLTPQGGLELLAGQAPDPADPGLVPEPPRQAVSFSDLAGGPNGLLLATDPAQGNVVVLTPGGQGERAGVRTLLSFPSPLQGCIVLGESGEILLARDREVLRLVPRSGRPCLGDAIPRPGTARCTAVYDPVLGTQDELIRILKLVPGRDGGVYVFDEGQLWAFFPEPPARDGIQRWRSELVTVSGQHALPADAWTTPDPASTLPILPDFWDQVDDMAGLPGDGLLVAISGDRGIRLIGPPGDGALFDRVRAFRQAEADRDRPRALRILGALLRQRRLSDPEACELPFLALAHGDPGGAPPPLGPLPGTLQRLVGSFLVRPRVLAFRAAVAAEAILGECAWARDWVAAGCP